MNLIGLVVTVVLCLAHCTHGTPTPCDKLDEKSLDCTETEYEAYRDCIEEAKAIRQKRQTQPCPTFSMEPLVHRMEPFEILIPVHPLEVARKPMLKNMDRTIIVRPDTNQIDDGADDDENSVHYRVPVNVTTVIRLTNIVNNTNHIHMPTTLNNTNVNNIHVYANLTDGSQDDDGDPGTVGCCTAVRPKSCQASTYGVRCKHHKFRTCGPQCTAKVVHIQKRKRCNRSTGDCEEKIAYVPQPEKPTCVYIDDWPYVVCGKVANMSVICAGCYDHYGHGYESFHGQQRMQDECRGCYNDAFDKGPLYRRGPVLRPFYYHEPPCFITGSCQDSYENCGYGCYGHDRIDPAWGKSFGPALDASNTIYYDSDVLEPAVKKSHDWGVPTMKCAVVTDGDTITVKNCTDDIDNPYMAAPVSHPYYKILQENNKSLFSPPKVELKASAKADPDDDGSADGAINDEVFFVEEDVDDDEFDQ